MVGRGVAFLAWPRGRLFGCPYGTTGVTITRLIRSAFPNRGTAISAARTALCKRIEMASARRFTRRSRLPCSASPSTRHPLKDPRLSLGHSSETLLGSDDITHLHNFFREDSGSEVPRNGTTENFAAPISWGLL